MMRLHYARKLAGSVRDRLEPMCERIEIVGGVRREKPHGIKDVELLIIPKASTEPRVGELFESGEWFPLYSFLDELTQKQAAEWSRGKWGRKYRQLIWRTGSGFEVPFDLFLCDRKAWGLLKAIRTGPAELSRLMVTTRSQGGFLPDGWNIDGCRAVGHGQSKAFERENEWFEFLRLPYVAPAERSAEWIQQQQAAIAGAAFTSIVMSGKGNG